VDNVGELHLGMDNFDLRNGSAKENQFLHIARQYNSKVDWVIQKNDWSGDWRKQSRANKQAVFKKLVSNITLLLHTRLTDTASKLSHTPVLVWRKHQHAEMVSLSISKTIRKMLTQRFCSTSFTPIFVKS
jgi:hypothetical protein